MYIYIYIYNIVVMLKWAHFISTIDQDFGEHLFSKNPHLNDLPNAPKNDALKFLVNHFFRSCLEGPGIKSFIWNLAIQAESAFRVGKLASMVCRVTEK